MTIAGSCIKTTHAGTMDRGFTVLCKLKAVSVRHMNSLLPQRITVSLSVHFSSGSFSLFCAMTILMNIPVQCLMKDYFIPTLHVFFNFNVWACFHVT